MIPVKDRNYETEKAAHEKTRLERNEQTKQAKTLEGAMNDEDKTMIEEAERFADETGDELREMRTPPTRR